MMHGHEKSDPAIVAVKPANKANEPAAEASAVGKRGGAGGAKGGDRGECGPAKHVPGAEPGKRVTGAGPHTESRKGKEEGEVHRALPPHQHRAARRGVLRTQGGRSSGRGSTDVEGLRGRPRAQSRGLARSGPSGSVSGAAVPAGLHTQAGRPAAPARGRGPGGQDRPTGGGRAAERDLYEEDFLGISYGFRPGRGTHDALDALCVGIHSKKVSFILDADIRSFFDTITRNG